MSATSGAEALPRWRAGVSRYLHEPRFWVVQALILLAATTQAAAVVEGSASRNVEHLMVAAMYGLYTIPVVYASLNFGREGAVPTAIWAGVLSLPGIALWHHGLDLVADIVQFTVIIGLAVIIAGRVDREVDARRGAERAAESRRRSEARYRALFAAVGEPILVLDQDRRVGEENAAAERLFASLAPLQGRSLGAILGAEQAGAIWTGGPGGSEARVSGPDGGERWFAPVAAQLPDDDGRMSTLILLHDVTDARQRRHVLEAFARQVIAAQEAERQRIARDLHDGPVQELVLLCRRLDELATEPAQAAASSGGLAEARRAAEAIADELRRLSRDLRPSILDDLGLVPAVRWLVMDLERRAGVRARFVAPAAERRLAPAAELALFRIAQEALRNVERHAHASEVTVELALDGDARLVVSDDGRGMAAVDLSPAAAVAGTLGLLGMQERARLRGGALTIITAPAKGTRVEATIPVSQPDQDGIDALRRE